MGVRGRNQQTLTRQDFVTGPGGQKENLQAVSRLGGRPLQLLVVVRSPRKCTKVLPFPTFEIVRGADIPV
jgi:hypothetical protein